MDDLSDDLQDELAAMVREGRHQQQTNTSLSLAAHHHFGEVMNSVFGSRLLALLEAVGRRRQWELDSGGALDADAALVAALLEMLNRPSTWD